MNRITKNKSMDKFKPMLLSSAKEPFDNEDYIFEFKFDGVRMLADCIDDIVLYNRHQNMRTNIYPEIATALKSLEKGIVLDGEVIALDMDGKQNFYKLLQRDLRKIPPAKSDCQIYYVVFDILAYKNSIITSLSLHERKQILDKVFLANTSIIKKTDYVRANGIMLYSVARAQGLEGIVAKKLNSPYIIGARSENWQKIKCFKYIDAKILGYYVKNRPSLYLGVENNGKFDYIGNVSNGLSEKSWQNLLKLLQNMHSDKNYFEKTIDDKMIFTKPAISINVKYLEKEPNGKLRQPIINQIY